MAQSLALGNVSTSSPHPDGCPNRASNASHALTYAHILASGSNPNPNPKPKPEPTSGIIITSIFIRQLLGNTLPSVT